MSLEDVLSRLAAALARADIPYMVTGSIASSAHGSPRSTRDIDVVVAPTVDQLVGLLREFPKTQYYSDEQQALGALAHRSLFNIIDLATGWKIDFIMQEDSAYGSAALARREPIRISGSELYVASAEDVLIAKLRWVKLGASSRQLQDAQAILSTQGSRLDLAYVERWIRDLGLREEWRALRDSNSRPSGS